MRLPERLGSSPSPPQCQHCTKTSKGKRCRLRDCRHAAGHRRAREGGALPRVVAVDQEVVIRIDLAAVVKIADPPMVLIFAPALMVVAFATFTAMPRLMSSVEPSNP